MELLLDDFGLHVRTVENRKILVGPLVLGPKLFDLQSDKASLYTRIWGNGVGCEALEEELCYLTNSDFQGSNLLCGNGNVVCVDTIDTDPMFVNAPKGNYLESPLGDYRLKAGSPAIDSADSGIGRGLDRNGAEASDVPEVADQGAGEKTCLDRGALEYVPSKK